MTNKRSTKSALLTSCMALLLCFTMLLGTTFAWFTDSVTSANNIIKSGNLDVTFEYWNGTEWATVQNASDVLTNELWEPGVTEVAYLRFANAGSLALKYDLGINIVEEKTGTNVAGDEFKLSDYLYFGVVEGAKENEYANRADAVAAVSNAQIISTGYTKKAEMAAGDEEYFALVVYMPETVDNVANHDGTDVPEIALGLNIYAAQLASEDDSFGSDYDADAKSDKPMKTVKVADAAELTAALINIDEPTLIDAEGVTLYPTGSLDTTVKIPAGVTLKGAEFEASSQCYLVVDGVGEDVKFEDCVMDGPGFGMFVIAGNDQDGANMVFESCTFKGQIAPNFTSNTAGKSTFNDCTFTVGSDNIGLVNCMGGEHTFNNCTFDYTGGATYGSNQWVRWNAVNSYTERFSTVVTLNGCKLINCGTQRFAANSGYTNTLTVK